MSICNAFASVLGDIARCTCGHVRAEHSMAARGGLNDLLRHGSPPGYEVPVNPGPPLKLEASDILERMATTFKARNAVYSDNYKMIAPMVRALFPNGVPPELVVTDHWHLFELILVKLARFAATNLTHPDSIHDTAIYAAMIEAIITTEANKEN